MSMNVIQVWNDIIQRSSDACISKCHYIVKEKLLTVVNTSYQVVWPEPDDIEMECLKKVAHRGQPRARLLRKTQAFRSTYGYSMWVTERDQRPSSTLAQHQSTRGQNITEGHTHKSTQRLFHIPL